MRFKDERSREERKQVSVSLSQWEKSLYRGRVLRTGKWNNGKISGGKDGCHQRRKMERQLGRRPVAYDWREWRGLWVFLGGGVKCGWSGDGVWVTSNRIPKTKALYCSLDSLCRRTGGFQSPASVPWLEEEEGVVSRGGGGDWPWG